MRSNVAAAGFAVLSLGISSFAIGQPPILHFPAVSGAPQRIEVQSWSWGASQAGSSGPQQAAVAAPRDAASGQATGKRQHGPLRTGGAAAASYAATGLAVGQPLELAFSLPEGVAPWSYDACATGVRYPQLEVELQDGKVQVEDALITCPAAPSAAGRQKAWVPANFRLQGKTGHVTVLK